MIDFLEFDNEIKNLVSQNKFSGCIQISNRKEILFREAYGYASKSYLFENKINTKFNIASVGKIFTSVAILQLVEKGVLSLNVPIKEYCQGLISDDISDKITIRHLLTHTSGLGDYVGLVNSASYQTAYEELDDFIDILKNATLSFEPGSKWNYSGIGYLLLGFIIKNITGDYYDYITKNIFKKAEMNESGFWLFDEVLENAATAHYFDEKYGKWRVWVNKPVTRGVPAGGGYSTVGDLTKFINALIDFKLINSTLVKEATTAKPEINSPFYGYGLFVNENEVGHGGDGTGTNAKIGYKNNGIIIVILSNISNGLSGVEALYNNLTN